MYTESLERRCTASGVTLAASTPAHIFTQTLRDAFVEKMENFGVHYASTN